MIIEPDTYYYDADGVYRWSPERKAAAWDVCFAQLDEELAMPGRKIAVIMVGIPGAGKSRWAKANDREDVVIFDGPFTDPDLRRRTVAIREQRRVPVVAVWLDTAWDTCVARNARRSPDRIVPFTSLENSRRMLLDHPPSSAEGFLAVQRVIELPLGRMNCSPHVQA